jgi:hypothetical protein
MPSPATAGLPNPAQYDTTSVSGVVIDQVTGLWWQQSVPTNVLGYVIGTQADALTYCAHLNLGGYCDWRLPTRIELVSIVDFTQIDPAINGSAFPNTPLTFFWTASTYTPSPGSGWVVNFADGHTYFAYLSAAYPAFRCVRGGA